MKKTLLNDGWEFSKNPIGSRYEDAENWQSVDLPHDWLIYDTNNLYETSTGWYRRILTVPCDGMRTSLRFEGVYMDSRVYVNGVPAGEWKYGYTTFEFDITDLLHEGENLISVRVDHHEPNSRWYSGAGIYRNVWLNRFQQTHIVSDGVYISAHADGRVDVTTEVERPEAEQADGLKLKLSVYKADSDEPVAQVVSDCTAADKSVIPAPVVKNGFKYSMNTQKLRLENPVLWDIDAPYIYNYTVELFKNDMVIDTVSGKFGFRDIEFTSDRGFFLNGRHIKLHGCCEHHDLGALGAAVNKAATRRKLETLRIMGINSVRTSHNPPAVELLELADEMGFLILDEGFDMWELKKTDYDYARFFSEWIERDVASWVRRDRNHPCVIGWSIGNEIYDTHAGERGQEVTSMLKRLVEQHDPRRNGYVTIGSNYMAGENAQRCADILKVAGYNYAERLYDEHHAAHPDWMIYGSETSSVVQSRGIYHFPLEQSILSEDDEQCSSLGNSAPIWAAKSWEACIIPDRDAEYCAGQFIWTGFDYIGEPTPYSTKNSYFGQIDTAGFFKDSAYVFRAAWTDYRTAPFIHIFPYWDFNEGEIIDVRVATNAPRAELYLNGEKIAEKDIDHAHGKDITLDAKLEYVRGELEAVAYDENGREVARAVQRSFGDTAQLRLTPDKTELKADCRDMIFIDISAYDNEGNFVANANNRVFVSVSGAGRLVGLDNGDSTDYEQYKGTSRRLFSGKLLAMVAAKDTGGEILVKVGSPLLPDNVLTLYAADVGETDGSSCIAWNVRRPFDCPDPSADIPVRKIELSADRRHFDAEHKELTVNVKLYPENTIYADDLHYRITTASGIDSPLAEIVSSDRENVTLRCLGDGDFYLRALCKNGTDKYHIMSAIKLTADGLGSALVDPYSLVCGGLYSVCGGDISNGIKHGAGIGNGGGWFGFENVDFGAVGSDIITIPLFANYSTPVRIKVYDGIPGDGGELLGDFEYAVVPVWLTYQPQTYRLSKVLRGIHTLCIQSDVAYDVEGFVFEKRRKETAELLAVNAESIYGDKFEKGDYAITGIGNNVTVGFGEFNFGENAPKKVFITGRSDLAANSIHIMFEDESGGEKRILAEFVRAEQYTEREFAIEGVSGKVIVSLIFLPGSDFDLRSIRFE